MAASGRPLSPTLRTQGPSWRVFYNSKAYVESGNISEALAGNWPYLVPKDGGPIRPDLEYRDAALGQ